LVLAIGFYVVLVFFQKSIQACILKGETITKFAEQYHVRASAIYELNQLLKKGH
jgi:LysM repeat protein